METICTKNFNKHSLYHLSDGDIFIGNFCDRCLADYLENKNPDNPMIKYYRNKAETFPQYSCPHEGEEK